MEKRTTKTVRELMFDEITSRQQEDHLLVSLRLLAKKEGKERKEGLPRTLLKVRDKRTTTKHVLLFSRKKDNEEKKNIKPDEVINIPILSIDHRSAVTE